MESKFAAGAIVQASLQNAGTTKAVSKNLTLAVGGVVETLHQKSARGKS
jgi:hypothetical protein